MAGEDVAWYQRMLDGQPDLVDFPWCWTVVQPLTKPVTVAAGTAATPVERRQPGREEAPYLRR